MKVVDFSANLIGREQTLKKFNHLWKLDDPGWVKQRRAEAKLIASELSANGNSVKTIREYTRYFCKGEKTAYIDPHSLFFMTPIDSAETAKAIFESQLLDRSARKQLYQSYATMSHDYWPGLSGLEDHVRFFIRGVLGETYEEIEQEHAGRRQKISPPPSSWCAKYVRTAVKLFKRQDGYYGCIDCFPYFVSALPYMDDPELRMENDIASLFEQAEIVTGQPDAMPQALELAQTIIESKAILTEAWLINSSQDRADDS